MLRRLPSRLIKIFQPRNRNLSKKAIASWTGSSWAKPKAASSSSSAFPAKSCAKVKRTMESQRRKRGKRLGMISMPQVGLYCHAQAIHLRHGAVSLTSLSPVLVPSHSCKKEEVIRPPIVPWIIWAVQRPAKTKTKSESNGKMFPLKCKNGLSSSLSAKHSMKTTSWWWKSTISSSMTKNESRQVTNVKKSSWASP